MASLPALASIPAERERRVRLANIHTGEEISGIYWADGQYIADHLGAINYVLRDHRHNETHDTDTSLLDLLYAISTKVESNKPFHVISGYRTPATNEMLRQKSTAVAKNSLHMQGKAIDIRIPGIELKYIHKAALALRSGGVGFYTRSRFREEYTG